MVDSISGYYNGKSILVTGGSGFMGKVLVEKLLYSCPGVKKIFLLLRTKRGKAPESRIEDITKSMIFNRLHKEFPERLGKLQVVSGDIGQEELGISEQDRKVLQSEVNIVFHSAATLRLDTVLKQAINMNVTGTYRLMQLCCEMKNLECMIHISTTFCHVDYEVLEEKVYPVSTDPDYLIQLTKWMDDSTFELITPKLMSPHPNSYTYSKRLGEVVVSKFFPKIPVVIVRPSIVCPIIKEPLPGWVDNINGPVGILIGAGKGVIRSMLCDANSNAEVMPVDYAINGLLLVAATTGSMKTKPPEIPVYNLTQGKTNVITWGEVLDIARRVSYKYPFDIILWYPNGNIRTNKHIHDLCVLLFHWLPAYLIDGIMLLINRKPFLIKIQTRIQDGLGALQYFTMRDWVFKNEKFLSLRKNMSEEDKKTFNLDFESANAEDYFTDCCIGARHYYLKEDPATLPRSRRKIRIYWFMDLMVTFLFYLLLLWLVISSSYHAKSFLDAITNSIFSIPFFRMLKQG